MTQCHEFYLSLTDDAMDNFTWLYIFESNVPPQTFYTCYKFISFGCSYYRCGLNEWALASICQLYACLRNGEKCIPFFLRTHMNTMDNTTVYTCCAGCSLEAINKAIYSINPRYFFFISLHICLVLNNRTIIFYLMKNCS